MTETLAGFVDRLVNARDYQMHGFNHEELWLELIDDGMPNNEIGFEKFEEMFLRNVGVGNADGVLEFRPGGWIVNVSEGLLKGVITAALLAGFFAMGDLPALPALVLPAVIPILFDTEKVRLTKSEGRLLASLTLHDDVRTGKHSEEALYAKLPVKVQEELSNLDFAEFLEKCRTAGLADVHADNTLLLRPAEEPRFRITGL
jgi:hypothetical protein